jgi:murein L,D-transpeptidase YcbB/YkuD
MGRSRAVRALKRRLHRIPIKGHKKDKRYWRGRWGVNSRYGRKAQRVVKQFQRDHGMKADGVVGPATWRAINRAAERAQKKRGRT